jgi:predicted transposase YdaD
VSKPFDATSKALVETAPADWLTFLGLPGDTATVIDADVSTVTAEADRVIAVRQGAARSVSYILHIEFQASYKTDLPERMLRYNVLLRTRHRTRVRSVLVLLRPEADGPVLTGTLSDEAGPGSPIRFEYDVLRVFDRSPDDLLNGPVSLLPLAPLSRLREEDLPGVIQRMQERLTRQPVGALDAGTFWTATNVLMGLRYDRALAERLLREVRGMEESVTYQAIVAKGEEKGRAAEARNLILLLGGKRFGTPDPAILSRLNAVRSLRRLEQIAGRILEVETWDELFP